MRLPAGLQLPGGFHMLGQTLKLRDYRLFVIGNFTSYTGLWVQRVAIGWLAWQLTHSPAWLGIVGFADQFPTLVFGLFAGTLTDRVDYFKMLRITQSLTMVYSITMAVLTFTGWIDIWSLLALTLFRGTLVTFNRPSRMTIVYNLVGRDMLPSVVSFNSMTFNLSRFIGPAIGGYIVAYYGNGWTFTVGAFMFLVFTICLRMMKPPYVPPAEKPKRSFLADSAAGLSYVMQHKGIRTQMIILTLTSLFAKSLTDLLPGFAAEVFENGAHGLAMLQSSHGVGAMIGGLLMLSYARLKGLTRITLSNILIMGAACLAFALVNIFWVACILIGWLGYSFVVQSTSNQTLIQSAVDPEMRGRVMSLYGLVARGGPAVGTLIMGAAAEHFGMQAPVAVGGTLCLVLWIWAWRQRKPMAAALEAEPPEVTVTAKARVAE
ncbi:MAG TPA: MFS transporter [Alphaproteobacteria bacterium]|jgi:MFS family permease